MGQAKNKKKRKNLEVKIQGIREDPYMITDELVQWIKLGLLVGELEVTYQHTENKKWHKWLKMATTLCNKVLMARIGMVDEGQRKSVVRRKNHSEIQLLTSDQARLPGSQGEKQEIITVALEDLYDVADLALNSCLACPQGECVKGCFYRKVFHRLGFPVARECPNEGECEFVAHSVGEVAHIQPQNQRVENYFEEDNKL